jgi:BTB/POZ domain
MAGSKEIVLSTDREASVKLLCWREALGSSDDLSLFDVVLETDYKMCVPASRSDLAAFSPFFRSLFSERWRRPTANNVVQLHDVKHGPLVEALEALYARKVSSSSDVCWIVIVPKFPISDRMPTKPYPTGQVNLSKENVEGLFDTADRLQFLAVREACTTFLTSQLDIHLAACWRL